MLKVQKYSMAYIISKPWGGHCGIGHQFQNWLVGYLLANKYGLTFVHSPFCGNITEPQIDTPVQQWEKFLGFGRGFIVESQLLPDIERVVLPLIRWDESTWDSVTCDHPIWKNIIKKRRNDNVLFECAKDQFIGLGWKHLDAKTLQANYQHSRITWPMTTCFDQNKLNVAIHIRRGDVTEHGQYRIRWVADYVYKKVMDQINSAFSNVAFHVFSDGTQQDLSEFIRDNTTIHSRSNIFNTFHQMVSADIFMPGQSAFSVLAGHLCKGTLLARSWSPMWNNFPKNNHFAVVDQEGKLKNDLV